MHTGARIKHIRTFRGITQPDFGTALGFDAKNAAIRISQYESNYRVPKDDMVNTMAEILQCSPIAIRGYSDIPEETIMESLFWLEEEKGYDVIDLTELADVYSDEEVRMTYNVKKTTLNIDPVALVFHDDKLSRYMSEWHHMKKKLADGEISKDEYFIWKINWPLPYSI